MFSRYRVLLLAAFFCSFSASSPAQWLYVTDYPVDCVVDMEASIVRGQYVLCVHAPDHGNAIGVVFRLEVDDLGSEDEVILSPASGVMVSGDIRTGAAATWSPRALQHEPIATLSFVDHDPAAPFFPSDWLFIGVRDAFLLLPGGGALPMENTDAIRLHCEGGGGIWFDPPASPEVAVGRTSVVAFRGMSTGGFWGPGATQMVADDTEGWVVGMSPNWLWNNGCGKCPWFWEAMTLTVTVPKGTVPGSTSLVTISEAGCALGQFSLEAIAPTGVETATWGAIKAMYR